MGVGGERRVGDTRERKSYEFIFRTLELAAQGRSSKLPSSGRKRGFRVARGTQRRE